MLKIHTKGIAIAHLRRKAIIDIIARAAASKSPYAAGFTKQGSKATGSNTRDKECHTNITETV